MHSVVKLAGARGGDVGKEVRFKHAAFKSSKVREEFGCTGRNRRRSKLVSPGKREAFNAFQTLSRRDAAVELPWMGSQRV